MKKLFVTTTLFAISLAICSGADKDIITEIKNVTVYRQGALVSRTGDIFLQKGNTTLLFKGLPEGVVPESIQAKATGEVMITSVNHSIDYLNRNTVSKEISSLNERRRTLADSIKMLGNYRTVYVQEKEMILANRSIAGGNGVDISELEQAAVFFRKRLSEIEVSIHKIDNILYDLKKYSLFGFNHVNAGNKSLFPENLYLPAGIFSKSSPVFVTQVQLSIVFQEEFPDQYTPALIESI